MEKKAIEGPDQDIEFEEDKITMEIPEIDGWTVIALTPAMVCSLLIVIIGIQFWKHCI